MPANCSSRSSGRSRTRRLTRPKLLADANSYGPPGRGPQPRLSYANAVLPDSMIGWLAWPWVPVLVDYGLETVGMAVGTTRRSKMVTSP